MVKIKGMKGVNYLKPLTKFLPEFQNSHFNVKTIESKCKIFFVKLRKITRDTGSKWPKSEGIKRRNGLLSRIKSESMKETSKLKKLVMLTQDVPGHKKVLGVGDVAQW